MLAITEGQLVQKRDTLFQAGIKTLAVECCRLFSSYYRLSFLQVYPAAIVNYSVCARIIIGLKKLLHVAYLYAIS